MAIADLSSILRIFGESSPSEEKQKELYREVLLMTLARGSRSDADIHPLEVETIQQIMQRETGQELTKADIIKAARPELYESANLRKYLRSVRRQVKASDRVRIMEANSSPSCIQRRSVANDHRSPRASKTNAAPMSIKSR